MSSSDSSKIPAQIQGDDVGARDPMHLDDHGVDDLAQMSWWHAVAVLELPEALFSS